MRYQSINGVKLPPYLGLVNIASWRGREMFAGAASGSEQVFSNQKLSAAKDTS